MRPTHVDAASSARAVANSQGIQDATDTMHDALSIMADSQDYMLTSLLQARGGPVICHTLQTRAPLPNQLYELKFKATDECMYLISSTVHHLRTSPALSAQIGYSTRHPTPGWSHVMAFTEYTEYAQ